MSSELASEALVPVKVAELFRWSESKGGEVTKRFLPPFSTPQECVKLVYRIKIDIANINMELKPGMPADATIELKEQ